MNSAQQKIRALDRDNQQAAEILAAQQHAPESLQAQWAAMVLKREVDLQPERCAGS